MSAAVAYLAGFGIGLGVVPLSAASQRAGRKLGLAIARRIYRLRRAPWRDAPYDRADTLADLYAAQRAHNAALDRALAARRIRRP